MAFLRGQIACSTRKDRDEKLRDRRDDHPSATSRDSPRTGSRRSARARTRRAQGRASPPSAHGAGCDRIAFTLSWIASLAIPAPSPKLTASGAEITAALAGHETAVAAQFALTEGLPAAGLAIVPVALARAARVWSGRGRPVPCIAGVTGAVISLAQLCSVHPGRRPLPARRTAL